MLFLEQLFNRWPLFHTVCAESNHHEHGGKFKSKIAMKSLNIQDTSIEMRINLN